MAKTTHTNRGTCQVCGKVQAIDNGTMLTAKHGYVVAGYGFFNGICPGARYQPAEKSLTVTHEIIVMLTKDAEGHDARSLAYTLFRREGNTVTFLTGAKRVTSYQKYDSNKAVTKVSRMTGETYTRYGAYVSVAITDETPGYVVEEEQRKASMIAEQEARQARSHIAMMQKFIVPRLGQELHAGKEKAKVWAVGDEALIGGKRYTVERIADAVVRGCGPGLNGQCLPHLYFSKPKADGSKFTWGQPARTTRRPKTEA